MARKNLTSAVACAMAFSLAACGTLPNLADLSGDAAPGSCPPIAELRKLVEPCEKIPADAGTAPKAGEQQIELEVRVMCVCPAYTKGAFFADAKGDKLMAGRLKLDRDTFVRWCRTLPIDLWSRPRLETFAGQPAPLELGGLGGYVSVEGATSAIWFPFAAFIEFTPIVRDKGDLIMNIRASLAREKPAKAGQGTSDKKEYEPTVSDTIRVGCRSGETLVVGGLRQKRVESRTVPVPFLSDLPVVGASMSYQSSESIEEELVIVVTPTVLGPAK